MNWESFEMLRSILLSRQLVLLFTFLLSGSLAHSQSLQQIYQKEQRQEDWRNDCKRWDSAQWIVDSTKRIKVLPDGRLLTVTKYPPGWRHFRSDKPGIHTARGECIGSWGVLFGGYRMGFHKHFYSDGSGFMADVKVENGQLVSYYVSCKRWRCRKEFVDRNVLGTRIQPAAPPS